MHYDLVTYIFPQASSVWPPSPPSLSTHAPRVQFPSWGFLATLLLLSHLSLRPPPSLLHLQLSHPTPATKERQSFLAGILLLLSFPKVTIYQFLMFPYSAISNSQSGSSALFSTHVPPSNPTPQPPFLGSWFSLCPQIPGSLQGPGSSAQLRLLPLHLALLLPALK